MTVLAAIDFSKNSYTGLRRAARLAREAGEPLVVAHSVVHADENAFWRHFVQTPWEVPQKIRAVAQARLRESVQEVLSADEMPDDITYVVELKNAADGILEASRAHDADLVVLGATGSGKLHNALLGCSAERVIRKSEVPVIAVPPDAPDGKFEKILAPVDFSDCSRQSLCMAADIARREGAKLFILHAFALPAASLALLDMQAPPESVEAYEEQKWAEFDEFVEQLDLDDLDCTRLLRISSPAAAIQDAVDEEDIDLICMGTHGRRGLDRVLLGSTAAKVLRRLPCSVMTVPTFSEK